MLQMDDSVEVEMKDAHVHSNSDDDIQQYVDNMVKVASSIKEKVIICRQHIVKVAPSIY